MEAILYPIPFVLQAKLDGIVVRKKARMDGLDVGYRDLKIDSASEWKLQARRPPLPLREFFVGCRLT